MQQICQRLLGIASSVCTPPSIECARWQTLRKTSCDAAETVSETVCNGAQTVTETICDATETVTETVCDSVATATQTVCDAWSGIPVIGGLVCALSHVVSTVVCTSSHVVSTVICTGGHVVASTICVGSHIVSTVICVVSHIVTSTICVGWTVLKGFACMVVGGVARLICAAGALLAGPGRILQTGTIEPESRPNLRAVAHSFVLASNFHRADFRAPYEEEGLHVEYRVNDDGEVEWARGPGDKFEKLRHDASDLPPFAVDRVPSELTGALAVSYDRKRLGEWGPAPSFDMIAASGDRIIAKAEGKDERIFICVTAHPYVHFPVGGGPLALPQSFFKLDPELGKAGGQVNDLLAHVRIPGDDERHPATERYPVFRALFEARAIEAAGRRQEMDIWFAPRIWHKVDLRPGRRTADPPGPPPAPEYPTYEHVVYETKDPSSPRNCRRSIRFEAVLGLGVGLSHLHEQHDHRFGGEMDNLDPTAEIGFQFANGPVRDYGGWVDGTTIYYVLVQLKRDEEIERGELNNAYAILWADEQLAFTERWRVLDIFDRKFNSPFQPIIGVAVDRGSEFYLDSPFDKDLFWSPLRHGYVDSDSRMAVARQIVLVTGRDVDANGIERKELYSIHFSWPTMDKTWRWRLLPGGADPVTLRLREDSTIVLAGTLQAGDRDISGWWFQRYLPADGQEQPSIEERAAEAAGTKPAKGYSHPWSFVSNDVFPAMDQRFSHLGVYEAVRSRIQFYKLKLLDRGELSDQAIEGGVWEDRGQKLGRAHARLNWSKAVDVLRPDESDLLLALAAGLPGVPLVGGPLAGTLFTGWVASKLAEVTETGTHPSTYSKPMSFRLHNRGALGWILTHFDKRDDKLERFDLPATLELTDRDDPSRTITVSVIRHFRNNPRAAHGRTIAQEIDAVSPPQVRTATVTTTWAPDGSASATLTFDLARNPFADGWHEYKGNPQEWIAMNVWRITVGALILQREGEGDRPPALARDVLILFEGTIDKFAPIHGAPTTFRATWNPTREHARLLSDIGRIQNGTSVWFTGCTGLACCADETVFEVRRHAA